MTLETHIVPLNPAEISLTFHYQHQNSCRWFPIHLTIQMKILTDLQIFSFVFLTQTKKFANLSKISFFFKTVTFANH